jgi:hypothetical protein
MNISLNELKMLVKQVLREENSKENSKEKYPDKKPEISLNITDSLKSLLNKFSTSQILDAMANHYKSKNEDTTASKLKKVSNQLRKDIYGY